MFSLLRLLLLVVLPLLGGMGDFTVGTAVTLVPVAGTTQELDPHLLGRWRIADGAKPLTVTLELRRSKTSLDRYEVQTPLYFARPVEGRVVQWHDKEKNRDWTVLECSVSVRTKDTGLLLPARHHFGLHLEGDHLVVSLLSMQLGRMALTNSGAHGAVWVRDLETTLGGSVAVIVTDGHDLRNQLELAAKRIRPQWVLRFKREP